MSSLIAMTYFATNNPFWEIQPRDEIRGWLLLLLTYMALIYWLILVFLGIKRWRDRNRPMWVYLLMLQAFFIHLGSPIAAAYWKELGWISNPALHAIKIMAFPLFLVVGFYLTVELFLRGSCEPNRYDADQLPPVVRAGFADWMVRCERPFLLLMGALIAIEVSIVVLELSIVVFLFALGTDPNFTLSD
jgi:uncharacterized membrane protein YhaH (DUF805 family)